MGAKIAVGQVVRLKSGGPKMTIDAIDDDGVHCIWFVKEEQKDGYFEAEVLDIATSTPAFGVIKAH